MENVDGMIALPNTDFAEARDLRSRLHEVVAPDRIVVLADALQIAANRDGCHAVHIEQTYVDELLDAAMKLRPTVSSMAYRWLISDLTHLTGRT